MNITWDKNPREEPPGTPHADLSAFVKQTE